MATIAITDNSLMQVTHAHGEELNKMMNTWPYLGYKFWI